MGHPIRVNRNVRILALAAALIPAFLSGNAIAGPDVTITNIPLPVTGTVGIAGVPNVRVALPAEPFFAEMELTIAGPAGAKAVGVPGRRLAISAITITNHDTEPQQMFLFNPSITGTECFTGTIGGGTIPEVHLRLEPRKTIQLVYPVPLVFEPIGGLGCIAGEVTSFMSSGVDVGVSGFTVAP
jgi:hypothetical protein